MEDAVEEKDEDSLQCIEQREEVRQHELCSVAVHVDETQSPGEAEKDDEHEGALDPRSAKHRTELVIGNTRERGLECHGSRLQVAPSM